jgi:hypothetical protein
MRPHGVFVRAISSVEFMLGGGGPMRLNSLTVVSHAARRRPSLIVGDLVIDGTPLLDQVERAAGRTFDYISPLGCMPADYLRAYAERLVGAASPFLPSGRCELLVCPECGDLGCGCVSCAVARDGDVVVWSELGWEADYDPAGVSLFPMGGFRFSGTALAGALGLPSAA